MVQAREVFLFPYTPPPVLFLMKFWFFWRRKELKEWSPRAELPRAERVSILDEIIHDDWYKPREKCRRIHFYKVSSVGREQSPPE